MKWTFAALVLLNIGLLMWASWFREEGGELGRGPRPPVNAEKMVPLLTPGLVLQPRPAGVARPEPLIAVEREAAASVEKSCQAIGPFETRAQATRAGAKLEALRLAYVVRPVEERIESGSWVFLPPLAPRAEAEEKRTELSSRGCNDHYLVREAGMVTPSRSACSRSAGTPSGVNRNWRSKAFRRTSPPIRARAPCTG